MTLPVDYLERVYAGALGKLIGVYLGRPFENWTYERILAQLGEVQYFLNGRADLPFQHTPLIVTDDDISGTFTFLRALPDHANSPHLTAAQIGETWLNYIIEQRTILWWGGLGNSTEHTAYLRLKNGIPAPHSGSIALNGQVVAEQIGAQIFIDGWAMVAPNDPQRAADLAGRAASVSHDGEAIYGAQVLAAMESAAFVETDLNKILDTALTCIPRASLIYRLVNDVRDWHAEFPDWQTTRQHITAHYGYDKYGGNCHMLPNHALIHLGLLYGGDDFQKALMITNTSGWDTDCNSGNVGCFLGIKLGLRGLEAGPNWRGPVADRLYLPTADGGRAITDAVAETYHIVNSGRALAGQTPLSPKNGARFHFSLLGSVQGFQSEDLTTLTLDNFEGRLALHYKQMATHQPARTATPTFIPAEAVNIPGYGLYASPTLYTGQTVQARVQTDPANPAPITVGLFLRHYGADDTLVQVNGPRLELAPGASHLFEWSIPETGGDPIAQIGLEVSSGSQAEGTLYLDYLTWAGCAQTTFQRPAHKGKLWRRAWVDSVDHFDDQWPEAFRLVQDRGLGLLSIGTNDWIDYEVSASLTPHLAKSFGLAVRTQGLSRYYALLVSDDGYARLVKLCHSRTILAETTYRVVLGQPYEFKLAVRGARLQASLNQQVLFEVEDASEPLTSGGIALLCEEGRVATEAVSLRAI